MNKKGIFGCLFFPLPRSPGEVGRQTTELKRFASDF